MSTDRLNSGISIGRIDTLVDTNYNFFYYALSKHHLKFWCYIRSFYSTEVEFAKLPKEVLDFLQRAIVSVDSKTLSIPVCGGNGNMGYLRLQVHTQQEKIEGTVYCKTAVAYHNTGSFDLFI